MTAIRAILVVSACWLVVALAAPVSVAQTSAATDVLLPEGVQAVWDLDKADRPATPTRQRVCLNGLWRWQPAKNAADAVPDDKWGYFKVPGCWPGITDYMQKDCQKVYAHPSWKSQKLSDITAAWYQREITVPSDWTGRRMTLCAEYVNSYAVLYVDGKKAGEIRFPAGEVDITSVCAPGSKHVVSMLVVAMPLKGVMQSYSDTASAKEVKGTVERRGLCGDIYLVGEPAGPRIADVKVDTSVRKGQVTVDAALEGLAADEEYVMTAQFYDGAKIVAMLPSAGFKAGDLKNGRFAFTPKWKPDKLWDLNTPKNIYTLSLTLAKPEGRIPPAKALDVALPMQVAFREFWIDGRDFYLNGTRIYLSAVPLDNAQVGAAWATYDAARESMERLKGFGINFVYTHNYGCEPGSHLSFAEILRAADDVGMLVSLSQPHFGHYEWKAKDADANNGYARHAEFYVRVAQGHPSVVFYSMSHNATGYGEDMNPDMIDGLEVSRDNWSAGNVKLALRAEAIVKKLDPGRIVYHHSSGNLGSMHTVNFYPNFAPIQELSDWLEHWAAKGAKPFFTCEYGGPFTWDWTMYRGWYKGQRTFGNAKVPWEFCFAEWNAQFLGDRAFNICDAEKANLRWETKQFRDGKLWFRWDYPFEVGSTAFDDRHAVLGMYLADNWRAFRTWGMSANSPWEHGHFWKVRDGVDRNRRQDLKVDWANLQRPGFSPDYIQQRYERMDLAYERTDWIATPAAQALIRNNGPLLAYIAGGPLHFTEKAHIFLPGQSVAKQIIVINNSRLPAACDWEWSINLPTPTSMSTVVDYEDEHGRRIYPSPEALAGFRGSGKVSVETGQQTRMPLAIDLPKDLAAGTYELKLTVKFDKVPPQSDTFAIHVLPQAPPLRPVGKIALFDPKAETAKLLDGLGVKYQKVEADADLAGYDILVIGKAALTLDGAAPNIDRVRDGLKVVVFEQTSEVLEKRFGFRVVEYGLRNAFARVSDHPLLAGLSADHLRDWRGEATLDTPRLKYEMRPMYGPTVKWCGIDVTRVWRCGNWGNVASVLIEKPARGDFLPIIDGGFSLQYSPLMMYSEGNGKILFCQMDVTGRTESDPAAMRLVSNILDYYMLTWKPGKSKKPARPVVYIGEKAGKDYLTKAGLTIAEYDGGKLSPETVLVVGPGAAKQVRDKATIAEFLDADGRMVAIGLDQADADAILPYKVTMKKAEHIATVFDPPDGFSTFADIAMVGIGPADVHNRQAQQVPLVTGGAWVVGDGVLAVSKDGNVAFYQLVPWEMDYAKQYNLKRTFRRSSFVVARLLAEMGVAGSTPILERFKTPLDAAKAKTEKRWLDGLYLDQPEEMDDPYRFFRW